MSSIFPSAARSPSALRRYLRGAADGFLLRGPGQRKRPLLAALYGLLALITISTIGIEAWSRHMAWEGYMQQSRAATGNIAQASSEHAEATLNTLRGLLDGLVERVETDGVDGPAGARLHRYMLTRLESHPSLHGLFVYDRTGRLVSSNRDDIRPDHNNADRAYFIHHRTHADKKEYLGKPVISRSSGEWVITLSRRIDNGEGGFAGVVVAAIPVRYFQRYYERFALGRQGAIIMAFADGTVVTRLPAGPGVTGSTLRDTPIYRHIVASRADSGNVMLHTAFDQVVRQHSYRRVPGYPLLVGAAGSREDILADWWRGTCQEAVVLLLMLSVIHAAGLWIIAQFRLHDRLQDALRQARESLEERNAELGLQARTDVLTGLCNRRHFDELLALEMARAVRSGAPFSLVMIDADYFKRFNDEYGHAAGDDCLRMIGAALRATVNRPGDVAARFGGEEFAILLPDTCADGALCVAEAVRLAVSGQRMPHRGNPARIVTVSAGTATSAPGDTATGRALLEAADAALYSAKAAGRDCVRSAQAHKA